MNPPPTLSTPHTPAELPPVGGICSSSSAPGWPAATTSRRCCERFLVPVLRLAGAQAGAVRTLSEDGTHMRLVGSSACRRRC